MRLFAALTLVLAPAAFAEAPDIASLYDVTTEGTSQKLKVGEKGKVVIAIKTKGGSHVSEEAPLRIELASKEAKVEKAKLTLADNVVKKAEGQAHVDPKFEVPFTLAAAGKGNVEAKMTFFICTEKLCARQQKTLMLPVEAN